MTVSKFLFWLFDSRIDKAVLFVNSKCQFFTLFDLIYLDKAVSTCKFERHQHLVSWLNEKVMISDNRVDLGQYMCTFWYLYEGNNWVLNINNLKKILLQIILLEKTKVCFKKKNLEAWWYWQQQSRLEMTVSKLTWTFRVCIILKQWPLAQHMSDSLITRENLVRQVTYF